LYEHGVDVENSLAEFLSSLYDQSVPAEEREKIEERIADDEAEAARYHEQSRRFALLSIVQNGETVCYEYDNCPSLLTAARWFVKALKDDGKTPFDDGYRSDMTYMTDYVSRFETDPRITLCAEINHDSGYIRARDGSCWVEYSAARLTEAIRAADSKQHLTPEQREQIFEDKLNEGNPEYGEDEDESEGMAGLRM
jgi:hypothetical protein